MNVEKFFAGKVILLTGTTGFIGKVILEKIIRSAPDFKKIYVMVRQKKNQPVQTRVNDEILSTEIFQPLFYKNESLRQQLKTKLVAVAGDLVRPNLGIAPEVRKQITEDLQIVINCAASVNFDDPLPDALQINYFGCLRMLELAKECKNIEVFEHVSTAYVNSNRSGFIEEKIYNIVDDPEQQVASLQKLNPQYLKDNEKQIIGSWPNTYTYTKSLAERALFKLRGNIPIIINRPSIVMGSYDEPMQGWTDAISASGGIMLGVGLGVLRYVKAKGELKTDIIPADFVSNAVLAGAAYSALIDKGFMIYHSCTSQDNACTLGDWAIYVTKTTETLTLDRQFRTPVAEPCSNPTKYQISQLIYEDIPLRAADLFTRLPFKNKKKNREQFLQLERIFYKFREVNEIFVHFLNNYWIYETKSYLKVLEAMDEESRQNFCIDYRNINWQKALTNYFYGIKRFYFKEDIVPREANMDQILLKNDSRWFGVIRDHLFKYSSFKEKDNSIYFKHILDNEKYQKFLEGRLIDRQGIKADRTLLKNMSLDMASGRKQLDLMRSKINFRLVATQVWFFYKRLQAASEGLHVDTDGLKRLKELLWRKDHHVILMPMYQSYADLITIQIMLFNNKMDIPFAFGNLEDTPRLATVDNFIRNAGYILSARKATQSLQSNFINSALLKEIIADNHLSIVFQNSQRVRNGKLNLPTESELAVKWILDAFKELRHIRQKIVLIPLSINYDRIFEMDIFAQEMITGEYQDFDNVDLVSRLNIIQKGFLGNSYVRFGEQIVLHEYLSSINGTIDSPELLERAARKLSVKMSRQHQTMKNINLTMIVSACLAYEKSESMKMKKLVNQCALVFDYLRVKVASGTAHTYISVVPNQHEIEKVIIGLRQFTMKDKGTKNCVINLQTKETEPVVKPTLVHYSNGLSQVFFLEGFITLLLINNYEQNKNNFYPVKDLATLLIYFQKTFRNEGLTNYETEALSIVQRLSFFAEIGALEWNCPAKKDSVRLTETDKSQFISHLFAELVRPLVNSYQIVIMSFQALCGKLIILKEKNLITQLHRQIQKLYNEGVIPHQHSSLKETLKTCIGVYSYHKLVELQFYGNKSGSITGHLSVPENRKQRLQDELTHLEVLYKFTNAQKDLIGDALEIAIQNSQQPFTFPRNVKL